MKSKLTVQEYAAELLAECKDTPCPKRAAFIDALSKRGQDARTKQFKHYDKIIKYMMSEWAEILDWKKP